MKKRHPELSGLVRSIALDAVMERVSESDGQFGVVSVVDVSASVDGSYADVTVTASGAEEGLAAWLAPIAHPIQRDLGRRGGLRKAPRIRFRVAGGRDQVDRVLDIISKLPKQPDETPE